MVTLEELKPIHKEEYSPNGRDEGIHLVTSNGLLGTPAAKMRYVDVAEVTVEQLTKKLID